eukprot:6200424-Pleurochrysis_carterae.AAC.1
MGDCSEVCALREYVLTDTGSRSSWTSCIIDETDGNKNKCPSRTPKLAADDLKDAMKLHVVGIIFHGKPDTPHYFPAASHLAGNTNLNDETVLHSQ